MKLLNNYAFYFFLLLLMISLTAKMNAQSCNTTILTTQAEIDAFNVSGVFDGGLVIGPISGSGIVSDIQNLNGLIGLTGTGERLTLQNLPQLNDISGLSNLTATGLNCTNGNVIVIRCPQLADLSPLGGLTEGEVFSLSLQILPLVDDISFIQNIPDITNIIVNNLPLLENLDDLSGLNFNQVSIFSNPNLTNIDGLISNSGNLNFSIQGNPMLENLNGLANVESGRVRIISNENLSDLSGLGGMTTMFEFIFANNDNIQNLDGLNPNLFIDGNFGNVAIEENDQLSDCAAMAICDFIAGDGTVSIFLNAPGCNTQQEVIDECQQVPCPDLSPTTFTYNENNNTWTVVITNLGTEAIDFSGNSAVAQAYWNSTPTVAGGLPAGGFVMSGTLAPGATFMTTLSAGANPAQEYLVLMVDLNDDLVECDETNNLASILVNPPPTCDDEIQNGDETGVDCGGPDCDPCIATCDDGLQNGNETGVDCGGPDCDPCGPMGDITELFFSEYLEGSGSNKAVEIFNGTGQTVNLSGYRVELYNNGRELASGPNSFVDLSGSILDNDVFVIVNGAAAQVLTDEADLVSSSITGFNGDDALLLLKDGNIIDMFGTVGQDPGSAWSGGGVSTQDMTMVRSPSITAGVPTGFTNPSIEWLGSPQNTFDSIGFHRINMPVLPITLHSFNARLVSKSVQLTWQTTSEENTEKYTLERSVDGGRTFQLIGAVAARNLAEGAPYQYLDEQVAELDVQQLYYRLRAQDFDGTNQVFGPVMVALTPFISSDLKVFPNPLSAGEAVHIQGAGAGAKVELRAMDGRLLAMLQPTAGSTYTLPDLAPGVYLVRALNTDEKLQTGRFVVR